MMFQYNFLYLFSVPESAIRYSEPPPPPPDSRTFSVAPTHGDDDTDMGGLKPLKGQKLDLPTTSDNGRSDLLAAIRASGGSRGAGLKKAEERRVSSGTSSEAAQLSSSPSQGGSGGGLDLMGEISRKLAMRRKGMSGKADQGGNIQNKNVVSNRNVPKPSAGGAMDKISSMIPPPPPTTTNEARNNDDDSDDDDW